MAVSSNAPEKKLSIARGNIFFSGNKWNKFHEDMKQNARNELWKEIEDEAANLSYNWSVMFSTRRRF